MAMRSCISRSDTQNRLGSPLGFIHGLFGPQRTNPTVEFPRLAPTFRLNWDSGSRRLKGIAFGTSVDELTPLRPCDPFKAVNGHFSVFTYRSLGLEFSMEFYGLACIEFFLKDTNPNAGPTGVPCARPLIEPRALELKPDSSPNDLADHF